MKFDLILTNGCSFVQGNSLGGKNLPSKPVKKVPNRFSELVAEHFNAEEVNLSAGGSGNDRIFRTTFDWVESNKSRLVEKNLLICLGLSSPYRSEFFSASKQDYFKLNINSQGIISERLSKESKTLNKEDVENFSKVWFGEFFDIDERIKSHFRLFKSLIAFLNQEIPNHRLFIFNSLDNSYPEWFRNGLGLDKKLYPSWDAYIREHNLNPEGMWHPLETAHKEMAEYIIKKYS